eukprot:scaffold4635_cov267-Pinguiococcus_pyrenoidosus.AAC.28
MLPPVLLWCSAVFYGSEGALPPPAGLGQLPVQLLCGRPVLGIALKALAEHVSELASKPTRKLRDKLLPNGPFAQHPKALRKVVGHLRAGRPPVNAASQCPDVRIPGKGLRLSPAFAAVELWRCEHGGVDIHPSKGVRVRRLTWQVEAAEIAELRVALCIDIHSSGVEVAVPETGRVEGRQTSGDTSTPFHEKVVAERNIIRVPYDPRVDGSLLVGAPAPAADAVVWRSVASAKLIAEVHQPPAWVGIDQRDDGGPVGDLTTGEGELSDLMLDHKAHGGQAFSPQQLEAATLTQGEARVLLVRDGDDRDLQEAVAVPAQEPPGWTKRFQRAHPGKSQHVGVRIHQCSLEAQEPAEPSFLLLPKRSFPFASQLLLHVALAKFLGRQLSPLDFLALELRRLPRFPFAHLPCNPVRGVAPQLLNNSHRCDARRHAAPRGRSLRSRLHPSMLCGWRRRGVIGGVVHPLLRAHGSRGRHERRGRRGVLVTAHLESLANGESGGRT